MRSVVIMSIMLLTCKIIEPADALNKLRTSAGFLKNYGTSAPRDSMELDAINEPKTPKRIHVDTLLNDISSTVDHGEKEKLADLLKTANESKDIFDLTSLEIPLLKACMQGNNEIALLLAQEVPTLIGAAQFNGTTTTEYAQKKKMHALLQKLSENKSNYIKQLREENKNN